MVPISYAMENKLITFNESGLREDWESETSDISKSAKL